MKPNTDILKDLLGTEWIVHNKKMNCWYLFNKHGKLCSCTASNSYRSPGIRIKDILSGIESGEFELVPKWHYGIAYGNHEISVWKGRRARIESKIKKLQVELSSIENELRELEDFVKGAEEKCHTIIQQMTSIAS